MAHSDLSSNWEEEMPSWDSDGIHTLSSESESSSSSQPDEFEDGFEFINPFPDSTEVAVDFEFFNNLPWDDAIGARLMPERRDRWELVELKDLAIEDEMRSKYPNHACSKTMRNIHNSRQRQIPS